MAPLAEPVVVVTVRALLIPLGALLIALVGLGLTSLADQLCRALFGSAESLVAWIPWLGKKASNGLHAVEQRLTNYLGNAVAAYEDQVGASFHALGDLLNAVMDTIYAGEVAAYDAIKGVISHFGLPSLAPRVARVERVKPATDARITRLEKQLEALNRELAHPNTGHVGGAIKTGTRGLQGELDALRNWTLPRVGALEGEVGIAIPGELANLRARNRSIADRLDNLWHRVRSQGATIAGAAALALVGTALATLGAGWIRCSNWNRLGRHICRTPLSDIEGLLALLGTAAFIADYRQLVRLAQEVERDVAAGIKLVANV